MSLAENGLFQMRIVVEAPETTGGGSIGEEVGGAERFDVTVAKGDIKAAAVALPEDGVQSLVACGIKDAGPLSAQSEGSFEIAVEGNRWTMVWCSGGIAIMADELRVQHLNHLGR